MPGSTVSRGACARASAALEMPFCIDTTSVPAGRARPSASAASAVAPLFTHNNASDGAAPGAGAGASESEAAPTVRAPPSRSVRVRPCSRNAPSTRCRPTKVTGTPAAARQPPIQQPTAPAPITSTGPGLNGCPLGLASRGLSPEGIKESGGATFPWRSPRRRGGEVAQVRGTGAALDLGQHVAAPAEREQPLADDEHRADQQADDVVDEGRLAALVVVADELDDPAEREEAESPRQPGTERHP